MCKGSQKATTTSSNMPDPAAYALYQKLLGRAEEVSNTPYTPYGGDLVAPVNQQQQLGISNINAAQPFFNQAAQLSSNIATPLTAADIQQYQDPYTTGVVNATQANFRDQNEAARQKLMGSAAAQGALGGNRIGVAEGELARNQQLAQAPVIADLMSRGYGTGLNTALAMKDLQSKGVQGMLSAGQGQLGVAGAQLGAGTLQQQNSQQGLDAAYQQWQNQQAYPFQTTQWLANLGTGVGSQMGGTGTTTSPGPNQTSQILGGITSGIGMLGSMGFFAQGGRVTGVSGYAEGGGVVPDYVIPESEDSLAAQQEQLLRGDRAVQMFPSGTPELGVPEGLERFANERGAFHFNPKAVGVADVASASANGRENELLDLGPYSKAEVAELVKQGSPLLAIIERTPDGVEVRAALGTPETVDAQLQAMEEAKSPENTVTVQDFESILKDRMGSRAEAPSEGFASGGAERSIYRKTGVTPWKEATGVVPVTEFGMVRGSGAPRAPEAFRDPGSPKMGDMSGLGKALKGMFGSQNTTVHTPGGYSEAFPAPGASGGYRMGGVYVPVFGGARGGSVGVAGFGPETLQDLYGIEEVPGLASGGSPFRIYDNDELSPLDPPSGRDRDLLVRGVLAEAGNQGPVGMQSVANVVRNRAAVGGYGGDTVEGVLTKPYQFEPFNTSEGRARMGRIDPSSPAYREADAAVDRAYTGDDPTAGATHFYAPKAQAALGRKPPAWDDGTGVDIGDHRFFGGAEGVAGPEMAYSGEKPRGGLRVQPTGTERGPLDIDYMPPTQKPSGGFKPDIDFSSNGKLWPSLIAAGMGMLASRSPFAGVAIGEGGLAGLSAYSQMRGGEREHALAQERVNLEAQRLRMAGDVEARRAREAEWPYTRVTAAQQFDLMKPVQVGMDNYQRPIMAIRQKDGSYRVIDPETGRFRDEHDEPAGRPQVVPPAGQGTVPPSSLPPPQQTAEAGVSGGPEETGDTKIPLAARPVTGSVAGTLRDPAAGHYNEHILEGQPPRIANQVKAIAQGLEKPPSMDRKNPYNQKLMELVREYSPDFDATMFARRQRTANEFSVGVASRNLSATKTLAGHLEHLYNSAQKLDNSQLPAWNKVQLQAARQGLLGKEYQDLIKEYETNAKAVADEAAKVFAGQASALADREEWEKLFSVSDPKNVQMASIRKLVHLVDSRLDAMTDAYNSGMSTRHGRYDLISPEYKAIFDRMRKAGAPGAEKKTEEKKPAAVAKPTLDQFLEKARKANPGVPDEKLTEFYKNKYGAQ